MGNSALSELLVDVLIMYVFLSLSYMIDSEFPYLMTFFTSQLVKIFTMCIRMLMRCVCVYSENHELKPDQAEWVKETTEMIYKLLAETPPDGASFVQAVKHILKVNNIIKSYLNKFSVIK